MEIIPIAIILCLWCFRVGKLKGREETKLKIFKALHNEDLYFSLGKLNEIIGRFEISELRNKKGWWSKIVNNFRK